MATMKEHKVLKPYYYDKFSCIGAACETNCCTRPWRIFIDKRTYTAYRNVKEPVFRKKIENCVKRVRDERASDGHYAEFVLADGATCPFQAENGLCEIHRDLGEGFLCVTCRKYPRLVKSISGEYMELSVSMSCPEAVRVALFDEEPMEFIAEILEYKANDPIMAGAITVRQSEPETEYLKHGWIMREAAVELMQSRQAPIPHRMIVIGMMLNKAVQLHDEKKADEIPAALDVYRRGMAEGQFSEALSAANPKAVSRRDINVLLYQVIAQKAGTLPDSVFAELMKRYKEYNESQGIDPDTATKAHSYYKYFMLTAALHWEEFLSDWSHLMENYLVNYIFSELFPLQFHDRGLNPYHHTLILAEQFALLKMLLCGNYDPDAGFTKENLTRTFAHVAEMNQHTENPLIIAEKYKSAGLDKLAYLYYLLL